MSKVQNKAAVAEVAQVNNVELAVAKRGRPVGSGINPESARQKRLAALNEKRVNGELKRGRPVNPESARQKRLAELEAKRATGELKRGRPAGTKNQTKTEEVVVEVA